MTKYCSLVLILFNLTNSIDYVINRFLQVNEIEVMINFLYAELSEKMIS